METVLIDQSDVLDAPLHSIIKLNESGDETAITWDADVPSTIESARACFEALKAQGFWLFEKKEGEERGRRMTRFDAAAESIVAVKNIVAG